jgi:hypothetical protein
MFNAPNAEDGFTVTVFSRRSSMASFYVMDVLAQMSQGA